MNWFSKLFHQKEKENIDPMKKFLIVGLGNIGAEYVNTRHNIGFKVVDFFARKESISFQTAKLGDIAEYKIKGRTMILLKPNTYMNLSGKAVKYWMDKENIAKDNILVITDDLNLSYGTIRIKTKGSDGGHNGLKSIEEVLQTNRYARLRLGVDDRKEGDLASHVLGRFSEEEEKLVPALLERAAEAVELFVVKGLTRAMDFVNK